MKIRVYLTVHKFRVTKMDQFFPEFFLNFLSPLKCHRRKKKLSGFFFSTLHQITHDDQIFTFFVEIRFFDMVWRKILLRKENEKKLCFLTPWKIVILLMIKTSNSQVFTKWMFLLWKDNFMCSLHHLKQVWKKKFFQRFILFDPGFCSFCSKNSGKKTQFLYFDDKNDRKRKKKYEQN